jgi:RHS repeat-associated protein
MRLPFALLSLLIVLTLLLIPGANAQVPVYPSGNNIMTTPSPGSGHDYIKMLNETVNPANGSVNVRVEAPVRKQRGEVNSPYYIFGYDSPGVSFPTGSVTFVSVGPPGNSQAGLAIQWKDSSTSNCGGALLPGAFIANAGVGQTCSQYVGLSTVVLPNANNPGAPLITATCDYYTGFVYTDPFGSSHNLNLQWIVKNGGGADLGCGWYGEPASSFITSGGDSLYQAGFYPLPGAIPACGGTSCPMSPSYVADSHGRTVVGTSVANLEDTNGNQYVPAPQTTLTNFQVTSIAVPGMANSYQLTYGTTTRNYTPSSTFLSSLSSSGCPSSLPSENDSKTVVSAITLPNGKQYQFQYDPTYGLLTKITYPTGGWVSYTWAENPNSESLGIGSGTVQCLYQHGWPYLQKRVVSFDGTTPALEQDFTYTTTWGTNGQWTQKTTTVTTHDLLRSGQPSFQTTYTYLPVANFDFFTSMFRGQSAIENTIQYHDWSGPLLKTVTKNWNPTSRLPLLLSQCVTPAGGLTAGTFYSYGPLSVITDKKEYGYSSGLASTACAQGASAPTATPTRETVTAYQTFLDTPLFPTGPSMYDRPSSVKVYLNGTNGTLAAETDYFYDSYGNGITPVTAIGHDDSNYPASYTNRGNPTSVKKLCLQSAPACSSGNPTTTFTYDQTGQILSATDPNGNTTQYSFSDSFVSGDTYTSGVTPPSGNTNTYLTQITHPPTNGISHIEHFSYDYPSGQLTAAKDQNLQTTTYRYDDTFARPTQTTSPDGGKTTISYNDAPYNSSTPSPSVTTTKLISSSMNLTTLTAFDGLGHTVRSVLTSDPDCSSGDRTGTTYDGLGHVYTVSNPYCTTSDPTYGLTTYAYDGLGRTVLVVPPDGTTSANNIFTQYSGNCTTVLDQAGKARRSCTDGLGRLVEVDEPTSAAGGTPGQGSVTISGYDRSTVINVCPPFNCPDTIYDDGTLTVSVNGVVVGSAGYGEAYTPSYIASALASSINSNFSSPVSASANGSTVTLTAIATGIATNYSLSASSVTQNTQYFQAGSTSYFVSTSGASLTGGTSASLTTPYVTLYTYDALDNLTCAVQKATDTTTFTNCASAPATWRPRSFAYDSLSRLLSATNPESGTINYSYDANGNLASKTSPKPNQTGAATVVASYTYDALNRLTQKSFNNGSTPTVRYGYDGFALTSCAVAPPPLTDGYPVGRRTAMCDGAGAESWSHDLMGRVLTDSRTTNGVPKSTVYAYLPYVDGSLNTIAYPSTRTLTFTPSSAERLLSVVDATGPINYALNAKYAPQGSLAKLQDGGSLYSTFLYNKRLQPCWMYSTNTSAGAPTNCTQTGVVNGTILDYQYDFGLGVADNGNVVQIANRRDPTRTQSFTYDNLNRIATAQTQTAGVTIPNANCWGLTFGYDPWGNLLSWSTTGPTGCGEPMPLNVSSTNANQITGYCYDAAGNLLLQAVCPTGSNPVYTYYYDAESHLIQVAGTLGTCSTATACYSYDGDGRRVQKSTGKLYWYGASSDPLDETDLQGNTNNASFKEYVFFNGKRIARRDSSNNVDYYFADHLGTARVVTNAGGTILDDSDFYPFGLDRSVVGPSSGNTYKFTGKERDSESGLDNFGARYYASTLGRFMSPDPTMASVNGFNPQSWNRYAYVLNSPLKFLDPNGLWELVFDDTTDKKGKHHVTVTAKQSQKGDDGASLAKQLGLKGKAAEKFAEKIGSSDNVQLSKQGGTVGSVFGAVERGLSEQLNYSGKNGGPEHSDCSRTAAEIGFGQNFMGTMGTNVLDVLLGQQAKSESPANAMVGDIVRYADLQNIAKHFTTFIFADDSGTPIVFSKSGQTGPYQYGPAERFEGQRAPDVNYGTIQGVNKGDSGYYRPD